MHHNNAEASGTSADSASGATGSRSASLGIGANPSTRPRSALSANPRPVLVVGDLSSPLRQSLSSTRDSETAAVSRPPVLTPFGVSSTRSSISLRGDEPYRFHYARHVSTTTALPGLRHTTSVLSATACANASVVTPEQSAPTLGASSAESRPSDVGSTPDSATSRHAHKTFVAIPASEYEQFMQWKHAQQRTSHTTSQPTSPATDHARPTEAAAALAPSSQAGDTAHHQLISLLYTGDTDHIVPTSDAWRRRHVSSSNTSPEITSNLARSRTSRNTPLDLDVGPREGTTPVGTAALGASHLAMEAPVPELCVSPEPQAQFRTSPRTQSVTTPTPTSHTPLQDTVSLFSDGTRSHRSRSDTLMLSQSGGSSFNSARVVPSFFRASFVAAMSEAPEELGAALDQPMTAATYSLHHTRDSYDSVRSLSGGSHLGASGSVNDIAGSSSGSSVFMQLSLQSPGDDSSHHRSSSHSSGQNEKTGRRRYGSRRADYARDEAGSGGGAAAEDDADDEGEHGDVPEALRHAAFGGARVMSTKALPPVPGDISTANGLDLKALHDLHRQARTLPAEYQTRVYHRLLVDEDTQERFHVLNEKYVVYPVQIGRGSYARVKLVYSLPDKCFYALKIVDRRRLQRLQRGDAASAQTHEADLLWSLRHRNIVALREFLNDPRMRHVLFVLELAEGGEVMSLHNDGRISPFEDGLTSFPEKSSQLILYGVVNALMFAHKTGVAHRDVKPANVLLSAEGEVKLSDFGASVLVDEERQMKMLRQGSVAFLAPELLLAQEFIAAPRSGNSSTQTSTFATSRAFTTMSGRTSTQEDGVMTPATTVVSSPPHEDMTDEAARGAGHDVVSILLKSQSHSAARHMLGSSLPFTKSDATSPMMPGEAGQTSAAATSHRWGSTPGSTLTGPIGKPPLNASRRSHMGAHMPWSSLYGSTSANRQATARSPSGSFTWMSHHATSSARAASSGLLSTFDLSHGRPLAHGRLDDDSGAFDTLLAGGAGGGEDDHGGAPQVIDLFKADVFALGVTAFALLMGRLPWLASDAAHQFAAIRDAPDPFLSAYQDAHGAWYESPASYQGSFQYAPSPSFHHFALPSRRGTHGSSSGSGSSGVPSTPSAHALSAAGLAAVSGSTAAGVGSTAADLPPPVPASFRLRTISKLSDASTHGLASRSESVIPASGDRLTQPSLTGISSDGVKSGSFPGQSTTETATSHMPPLLSTLNFTVSSSMWMDDAVDLQRSVGTDESTSDRRQGLYYLQQQLQQQHQLQLQQQQQQQQQQRAGLPVWRSQLPADPIRLPLTPVAVTAAPPPPRSPPVTSELPFARAMPGTAAADGDEAVVASPIRLAEARTRSQTVFSSAPSLGTPKGGSATHCPEALQAAISAGHTASTGSGPTPSVSVPTVDAVASCEASRSSPDSVEDLLRDRLSAPSSHASFEADTAGQMRLLGGVPRRSYIAEETLDLPASNTHGPVSALAVDFVRACLHPDPAQRRTVFELFEHPWMQQVVASARQRHGSFATATDDEASEQMRSSTVTSFLDSDDSDGPGAAAEGTHTHVDADLDDAMPDADGTHEARRDHHRSPPRCPASMVPAPGPRAGLMPLSRVPSDAPLSDSREHASAAARAVDMAQPVELGLRVPWTDSAEPDLATPPSNTVSSDVGLGRSRVEWAPLSTAEEQDLDDARSPGSTSPYDSTLTAGQLQSNLISPLTAHSLGASTNHDALASLNGTAHTVTSTSVRARHHWPVPTVIHADLMTSPVTVSNSSLAATTSNPTGAETGASQSLVHGSSDDTNRDTSTTETLSYSQPPSSVTRTNDAEVEEHSSPRTLSTTHTAATGTDESLNGGTGRNLSLSSASEPQTVESATSTSGARHLPHLPPSSRPVSAALRHFLGYSDTEEDGEEARTPPRALGPRPSPLPLHPAVLRTSPDE